VKNELFRDEVPIELKQLVRESDYDGENDSRLDPLSLE